MLIDALFMLGLVLFGGIAGAVTRYVPLHGVAALVLSVVPFGGIPLSMAFC
jgi:hypothetical protein